MGTPDHHITTARLDTEPIDEFASYAGRRRLSRFPDTGSGPPSPPPDSLNKRSLHPDQKVQAFVPIRAEKNITYLGRGAASDVWLVLNQLSESPPAYVSKMLRVAPKHFDHWIATDEGDDTPDILTWSKFVKNYESRVSAWVLLNHENVIQVYDNQQNLNLHVEFCSNGSVRDIVDALTGLIYLHSRSPPIVHGSLNAGKLFIDEHGNTKIGEFGLAALFYPIAPFVPSVMLAGFSRWMSPELLDIDPDTDNLVPPTIASDTWALGCTIFEIATGQLPYKVHTHDASIQQAIISGERPDLRGGSFEKQYGGELCSAIEGCWSMDPSERPRVSEILARLLSVLDRAPKGHDDGAAQDRDETVAIYGNQGPHDVEGADDPKRLLEETRSSTTRHTNRGQIADIMPSRLMRTLELFEGDCLNVLKSKANKASRSHLAGRLSEAEHLGTEVLASRKQVLGEDHPDTLQSMANLAITYKKLGRLAEAELLGIRALVSRQLVLGTEHPDTLDSMSNLAITYHSLGRLLEAELLSIKLLYVRKRVLGEYHPHTLQGMANLVATYKAQGQLEKAELLGVELVTARKQALGEAHPETLHSMASLAKTYRRQGKWPEAESLGTRVLAVRKRVLGEEHPDTLHSMASLTKIQKKKGQLEEAEWLGTRTLASQRRTLGEHHPDTLQSMASLAATYYVQGQLSKAKSTVTDLIASRKRILGEEHPDTLHSLSGLAATYYAQGRVSDAESLGDHTLAAQKRVLGEEHPDTLATMSNLAVTYYAQGRFSDATLLGTDLLAIRKRILGNDHPSTLQSMANLARIYNKQGRSIEAESLGAPALASQKRVLGDGHPDTLQSMANLVAIYYAQDRLLEAEALGAELRAAQEQPPAYGLADTLQDGVTLAATYEKKYGPAEEESLGPLSQATQTQKLNRYYLGTPQSTHDWGAYFMPDEPKSIDPARYYPTPTGTASSLAISRSAWE